MNLKDLNVHSFRKELALETDRSLSSFSRTLEDLKNQYERSLNELFESHPGIYDTVNDLVESKAEVFMSTIGADSPRTYALGDIQLRLNCGGWDFNVGRVDSRKVFENGARVVVIVYPNKEQPK